jgi:Tfp pilus assembly protein PilV
MKLKHLQNESGLMLVEILIAAALITIGLVAVMQAFPVGVQGVDIGRRQSTAVFLAEQKLDQIKAWALSTQTAPLVAQGFNTILPGLPNNTCGNPGAPGNPCLPDGFATIAGYPDYSRTVTVTCTGACATATTATVQVRVTYRNTTGQDQVTLATMLSDRN